MEYRLARTIKWKRAFSAFNAKIILPVGSPVVAGEKAGEYWVSKDALPKSMIVARAELEAHGCMVKDGDIVDEETFLDAMTILKGDYSEVNLSDDANFRSIFNCLNSYSFLRFTLLTLLEDLRNEEDEDYTIAYKVFCASCTRKLFKKKSDFYDREEEKKLWNID